MKLNTLKYTLLILPLTLVFGCQKLKSEESKTSIVETPQVKTTAVKSVKYAEQINTTGRLAFNNEYNLSFKTAGIIEAIYVKEGQSVKAGQTLVTLNLNEIEATTSQARIQVDKAQRDYNRANALYKDSVVTLEQLENTESQLKTAQHNLNVAQYNLTQSKIRAPKNGIIQKIQAKENEIKGAGTPIIIFGARDQGKVLTANISDVDIVKIKLGDKASVHFDAWQETTFSGEVLEIEGMANPTTGTFEVKIRIEDLQNKLRPGFIGSAIITSSTVNHFIEAPIEGLVEANNKKGMVYLVQNSTAIERPVKIKKILNDKLLVSSGLSANDQIITEGFSRLKGDSIAIQVINRK